MGGVIFLSDPDPSSSSASSLSSGERLAVLSLLFLRSSKLPCWLKGLGTTGRLSLRIRLRVRMLCLSEMTWPAFGAAVTMVPGVAAGAGVGESDRKSG